MPKVLIVDDEPDIREVARFALEEHGFNVLEAGHADEARKLLAEAPDLMLLDWMLPGRSGLELAAQLKQSPKTRLMPIIMISARGEEEDRVKGLDTGVDDYISKPFSPREMVARVNAVLRRSRPEEQQDEIEIGGLTMDNVSHRVSAGNTQVDVAPTEYRLLHFFMCAGCARRWRRAVTTGCCRPCAALATASRTSNDGRISRATSLRPPAVTALRQEMRPALVSELALGLAVPATATSLWLLGLDAAAALLIAVLIYLARHLFLLGRLVHLITRRHRLAPPFPYGVWGDVYRSIAQYQQRARRGRKRQVRFTRRFREAADSVPDALMVLDKAKRIEWVNPAAEPLLNIVRPRDLGRKLTDVIDHPEVAHYIDAADYVRPLELAPGHDRTRMLSIRVAPFGERKRQRLVVGRDITKVFHLNMIRRDFVANVSHELRTPLTVVAGFVENLADTPKTPDAHLRPLMLMRNQTDRMRSIIDDLLTLSRLEMDEQAGNLETINVADDIHLILADARALSRGSHHFSHDIDETLQLRGNPAELHSAFSNLVYNAVKHTPEGTHVLVEWRADVAGPCFSVQDDGPGIPPQHVPRLTERFYRVDKARSRASGGTGLGLAIVKHVLNRHQARLTITSEPGHGSVFNCCFPATSAVRVPPADDEQQDDAENPERDDQLIPTAIGDDSDPRPETGQRYSD
jgi:two-component system phosphate regulon sensor histidine kinase PhoR